MARPRKVKVFNLDYKVKTADSYAAVAADAWGWLDTTRFTIYIRPDCPRQQVRETLLHEVIHAINNAVQVEDTKNQDEAIATRLTSGLLTVFRQNPKLLKWLFKPKDS
jgi:hypothetical protein